MLDLVGNPNCCFSHAQAYISICFTGADTLIYLALLPPNTTGPKGVFIAERKEIPFKAPDFTFHLQMTRE